MNFKKLKNKINFFYVNNSLIFKLIVSILVLSFVFIKLDINKIVLSLKNINFFYLIPCLIILLILLVFMTLKWSIFLTKYNKTNFKKLMGIYWASDFANLFGIGTIGGETYKMFSFKEKKKALLSSLIDRTYSFIWYIFLGVSIFVVYFIMNDSFMAILLGILLFSLVVKLYIKIERLIKRKIHKRIKNKFFKKIIFESYRTKKELTKHSFYCLIIISLQVILCSLIFSVVGFEIRTIELFIFIPILAIALVLPISFQGFGIREFLFITFAKLSLISPEKALIASFLLYLVELIYRLFGVIPFLILKK